MSCLFPDRTFFFQICVFGKLRRGRDRTQDRIGWVPRTSCGTADEVETVENLSTAVAVFPLACHDVAHSRFGSGSGSERAPSR